MNRYTFYVGVPHVLPENSTIAQAILLACKDHGIDEAYITLGQNKLEMCVKIEVIADMIEAEDFAQNLADRFDQKTVLYTVEELNRVASTVRV